MSRHPLGGSQTRSSSSSSPAGRGLRSGMFFSAAPVDTYAGAMACNTGSFNRFFHAMLDRGVYLAPSAFEAGFMSSAHGEGEIRSTVEAARAAFAEVASA